MPPTPVKGSMDSRATTFVVRLTRSADGDWTGVIERVRTGEKYRVGKVQAIGDLITQILAGEAPRADKSSHAPAQFGRIVDS